MNATPRRPITCDEFEALLPDMLEGTLSLADRTNADAHALSCARCKSLMDDLVEMRIEASRLPVLRPSHDLWDGISARIEAPPIVLAEHSAKRVWRVRAQLAAAAVVLVTATAGITWQIAQSGIVAPQNTAEVAAAPNATFQTVSEVVTPESVGAVYGVEIARLRKLLADRGRVLDTATARVLATNLNVIDDAIMHVKAALDSMPGSSMLSQQLVRAYDMKLNALRQYAALQTE